MDVREKMIERLERSLNHDGTGREMRFTGGDVMPVVLRAKQEWISVKDRLPEKSGNYLTYDPRYGDIEIYYYMGCGEWDHHRNGITDAESHGFAYWMPLPKPPKGE